MGRNQSLLAQIITFSYIVKTVLSIQKSRIIQPKQSPHGTGGSGMSNPADLCRECELSSRNRELERRLSEMAIEVVALTGENRVRKLGLKEES